MLFRATRFTAIVLGLLTLVLVMQPLAASATVYYWTTSTNSYVDAPGTWDLSTMEWRTGSTQASWGSTAPTDIAQFGHWSGTGGLVQVATGTTVNVGGLNFSAVGGNYSLGGGVIQLNATGTTAPAIALISPLAGANTTISIGTTLAGTAGLTMYGVYSQVTNNITPTSSNGALILTGSNTLTGGITATNLSLTEDFSAAGAPTSNIIAAANAMTLNSITLALKGAGGATVNSQTYSGLTINSGGESVQAQFAATTSGSGGLTINLGNLSRGNTGATVDFAYGSNASSSNVVFQSSTANTDFTSSGGSNTILGG